MSISRGRKGKISIRELTEDDIEALKAIDKKITGKERAITYRDPISFYLGGQLSMSFVAVMEGKIVGFVLGRIRESGDGWLQSVAVDPQYRRQGIGEKLVNAFVARCRSKGIKAIHTAASWRDGWMLSFLNAMGFARGEMVDLEMSLVD